MKYKGKEIGNEIPSLDLIQEVISEYNLAVCAQFVHDFWKAKNFKTIKGLPVKTLEAYVHVANSAYMTNIRKAQIGAAYDAEKWLIRYSDKFIQNMNAIKTELPQTWENIHNKLLAL